MSRKAEIEFMGADNVGELVTDYFKVTVSHPETGEIIYSNDKEKVEYRQVDNLADAFRILGADLDSDKADFLAEVFKSPDATVDKVNGEAVASLVKLVNKRLETSAINSARAKVIAFYTPMTQEDREDALMKGARLIAKSMGISESDALELVKRAQSAK